MNKFSLGKTIAVLFFFFIFISSLYFARQFLMPIVFAGILTMLFLPLGKWLERRGLTRAVASLMCVLLFLCAVCGVLLLFSGQISTLAIDVTRMHDRTANLIGDLREYVSNSLGIHEDREYISPEAQQEATSHNAAAMVKLIMSAIMKSLGVTALVVVYVFLLMLFRIHLKNFVVRLAPITGKVKTERMIQNASRVTQQYLTGTLMMMIILFIMYGIGFSIIGLKYAMFFAILCGLFQLVPLVGNVIGTVLTVFLSFLMGVSGGTIAGIIVTYAVIQLIYIYLLEPLVIESEVNINPLIIILVVIAGKMVWGMPGIVVAIPVLAIVKIFCDNFEPLQPYGFLIGGERRLRRDSKIFRWVYNLFNKKDKENFRYNQP